VFAGYGALGESSRWRPGQLDRCTRDVDVGGYLLPPWGLPLCQSTYCLQSSCHIANALTSAPPRRQSPVRREIMRSLLHQWYADNSLGCAIRVGYAAKQTADIQPRRLLKGEGFDQGRTSPQDFYGPSVVRARCSHACVTPSEPQDECEPVGDDYEPRCNNVGSGAINVGQWGDHGELPH